MPDTEGSKSPLQQADQLHELAAALAGALTFGEVVAATVDLFARAFGGVGAVLARISDDGKWLELVDAHAMSDDDRREWQRFPLDAPVPLAYVARTGLPVFLEESADWDRHFPSIAQAAHAAGHQANIVVPLMVAGAPNGALGVAFDRPRTFDTAERALAITVARQCAVALERARLYEAERAARATAEHANRAKMSFLASMSHELRTPLNAIGGYADLLALGIYGPVDDAQRDVLGRIQRSQKHLLGLINDVLNFAKVDAGHVEVHVESVPVQREFEYVIDLVGPQALAKHLLTEHRVCDREILVQADAEKLRQILINLFANAIKFTNRGTIRSGCELDGDGFVRLYVSDTGCGIAPAHLARVFEPFVQLERELANPVEGAGLGLAISRELARLMGGEITVESELGVGSRFTVRLPLAVGV